MAIFRIDKFISMKILFLHGLESKLNVDKRKVLEEFGKVLAPDINYSGDNKIIDSLFKKYEDQEIDIIIGSSMGGFTGFYLASKLRVAALLFNPALPYRSVVQEIPDSKASFYKPIHIILGMHDPIIKYSDTKDFLRVNDYEYDVKVSLRTDLEHRIPFAIFDEEIRRFFDAIS